MGESGELESWEYQGGTFTAAGSWLPVGGKKAAELDKEKISGYTDNPIITSLKDIADKTNIGVEQYPIIANNKKFKHGYLSFIYVEAFQKGEVEVYTFNESGNVISNFKKIASFNAVVGSNVFLFESPIEIQDQTIIGIKNVGIIGYGKNVLSGYSMLNLESDGTYKSTVNNFLSSCSAYVFNLDFATYICNNSYIINSILSKNEIDDFGNVTVEEYENTTFDTNADSGWDISFNVNAIKSDGYLAGFRIGLWGTNDGLQIIPFTCYLNGEEISGYTEHETISGKDLYVDENTYIFLKNKVEVKKGMYVGTKIINGHKKGKGNYTGKSAAKLNSDGVFLSKINNFLFQEDFVYFSEIKPLHQIVFNISDETSKIPLLEVRIEEVENKVDSIDVQKSMKLFTSHPEILPKISKFLSKLNNKQLGNENLPTVTNIIGLGDSIWALTNQNTKVENASKMPPCMTALNTITRIYNGIYKTKPEYYRYDSGIFTENGTFKTVEGQGDGYDTWFDVTGGGGSVNTRVGYSEGCSISFETPTYKNFCFIDRTTEDTGVNCIVEVEAGRLEVYNDSDWVEANGYQINQKKTSGGNESNTTYQRRTEFRKTSAYSNENFTVTIKSSASFLMYWGLECYDRNCFRLINVGHGGRAIENMLTYLKNEVYDRNPDFILFEVPLLNQIPGLTTPEKLEKLLDKITFGDGRNGSEEYDLSFYKQSNNWEKFQVVFVIPNFAQDYYSGNDETDAPASNGLYKRMDYYKHTLSWLHYNDLAVIDISQAMINYVKQSTEFETVQACVIGSGVDGNTFLNEGIHPNDKGAKFIANEIDFFNY